MSPLEAEQAIDRHWKAKPPTVESLKMLVMIAAQIVCEYQPAERLAVFSDAELHPLLALVRKLKRDHDEMRKLLGYRA